MQKKIIAIAAGLMALAIIFGALGAHALKSILTVAQLDSFETGVRYHVWHSLAIIIVQLLPATVITETAKKRISVLFLLGIVFFSFSIYLLSLKDVIGLESGASVLGPITPLGGLMFIGGWIWLAISTIRR